MKPYIIPTYPVEELAWLPVGPPWDRMCHLTAMLLFGDCPMRVHAFEVLVDRHNKLVTKCQDKEYLLDAILSFIDDDAERANTYVLHGRTYLFCAVPMRPD